MILELVTSKPLLSQVREIFREYQISLGVDLCFQDFEQELSNLPDKYTSPKGRLYLAFIDGTVAGCIALRPLSEEQCEMKRLYVRPRFREKNIGRLLAKQEIADAYQIGYHQIVLDTLVTITAAQELYRSLGFCEISEYCFNPIEGVRYMGLDLQNSNTKCEQSQSITE